MITATSTKLSFGENNAQTIYLAPYGIEELARHVPISDPALFQYEPSGVIKDLEGDPEAIVIDREYFEHGMSWGIYEDAITPDTFVGTVNLNEQRHGKVEDLQYTKRIQEVGTILFEPSARGRGIGTIAKLAVVKFALEQGDTRFLTASTSEHNTAAHRSLAKVGFAQTVTWEHLKFPGKELTTEWLFASPEGQYAIAHLDTYSPEEKVAIAEGLERYTAALAAMQIEQ